MTRIVFIDTETVSVTPGPATIWELGLIIRDERGDGEYLWQIRPDLTSADPAALKVGGYYERCRASAMAPGEAFRVESPPDDETGDRTAPRRTTALDIAADVAPTLSGAHLVAANPAFDAGHLAAFLRANGECPAWDYHLIDIGSLVRGWAAARRGTLPFPLKAAGAARVAGIDPDRYDVHTALGDARMLRDIYDAVIGGGAG